jgi:glycosyltransferase involved in cell wall biosynthesis
VRIALWSIGYCRGFGGSEQMVNALLRRLSRHGIETILMADGDRRSAVLNRYFASLPPEVEAHVDTFPNPLLCRRPAAFLASLSRYAAAALRLLWFLRRRAPEIVHLHFVSLDVFLLILYKYLFNYRLVVTFRGGDLTAARQSRLARLKVRLALRHTDAVTSVSQQMAACLRDQFSDRKCLCIPNGVDQAELRQAVQSATAVIPPDHFIYAGRLHPDKRVTWLLEIFRGCIEAGCDRNLYIVGDGEEREAVARCVALHGLAARVFLMGAMSRQAVLCAIAQARCLLLASSEEGCPNVVLEAMGLGVPVIAAGVGGVPELVVHGQTGYLFAANDARSAQKYILHLDGDRRQARALGHRGAEVARQKFDLAATVDNYLDLYRSLLGRTDRAKTCVGISSS